MSDTPMSLPECLSAFDDHELSQFLRGLDESVAESRRRENDPMTAWFKAVRDAGEMEQRRRRGAGADEATILRTLYTAAASLPDDARRRLMQSYGDLFMGKSTVAPSHPLAMLGGILVVILEAATAPPIVA